MAVSTHVYSAAQCEAFLCDNMRNAIRDIIREHGLDPGVLMAEWSDWVEKAVRDGLTRQVLKQIKIEFYRPNAKAITTRWDFPITYSGSGVQDDMWLDKAYLRGLIAKAPKPTADCVYRIILSVTAGATLPGTDDAVMMDTGDLKPRSAGTIVSTGTVRANATYWTK